MRAFKAENFRAASVPRTFGLRGYASYQALSQAPISWPGGACSEISPLLAALNVSRDTPIIPLSIGNCEAIYGTSKERGGRRGSIGTNGRDACPHAKRTDQRAAADAVTQYAHAGGGCQ